MQKFMYFKCIYGIQVMQVIFTQSNETSLVRMYATFTALLRVVHHHFILNHALCRTPTGTSTRRGYDVTSIRTYTYKHGRHGIPWRLSACANSVYHALSPPPPPRLGTRLILGSPT